MAVNDFTLLTLQGIGVPAYSARGLSQTLEPIAQAAKLKRTINGDLLDVSASQFQQYRSTITCQDQRPPAVDGVWPGKEVLVNCVEELCYAEGGTPSRAVVPDSAFTEEGFTFYRPRLSMRVMSFSLTKDEYGAVNGWTMELEESSITVPTFFTVSFRDDTGLAVLQPLTGSELAVNFVDDTGLAVDLPTVVPVESETASETATESDASENFLMVSFVDDNGLTVLDPTTLSALAVAFTDDTGLDVLGPTTFNTLAASFADDDGLSVTIFTGNSLQASFSDDTGLDVAMTTRTNLSVSFADDTGLDAVITRISYETETATLVAAFTTPPTTARKNRINTMILALKTAGVWSKLDLLYMMAAADTQCSKLNWKAPASYTLTQLGATTVGFTANQGYIAAGGSANVSCLDTGWHRQIGGVNMTQNSASIFLRPWDDAAANLNCFGTSGASNNERLAMTAKQTLNSGQISAHLNAGSTAGITVVSLGTGGTAKTSVACRTAASGAASTQIYIGVATTTPTAVDTDVSSTLNSNTVYVCATNENGTQSNSRTHRLSACGLGGALSGAEALALTNAIEAYMSGLAGD